MSQPQVTAEMIKEVPCIRCNAQTGQACRIKDSKATTLMIGYHKERFELRMKMPVVEFPVDLTPSEKALICYYAYVMICNSVAAKSDVMFGKTFTSEDVQRFFARQAVVQLKEDGFLK